MAQPEIDGKDIGKAAFLFGSNGAKWIAALIDSLGHLQVDVVASVLSTVLASIDGKDFATQVTLNALLTELKLKADKSETQPVSAASLPLPSGASREYPASPICDITIGSVVANTTWTEITAYTVTGGKTLYVTDFYASGGDPSAGFEFMYNLQVNGADKIHGRQATGQNTGDHLSSPIVVGSGVVVRLRVYHWAGGNKSFHGTIIGYEV